MDAMKITKISQLTGMVRTIDLPVTQEQIDRWKSGELIQRAMPHLDDDAREFLMTGIVPSEWDAAFGTK